MSTTPSFPSPIPPIKTNRLLIREVTTTDTPSFLALESREEVVRYQFYPPWDASTAQEKVCDIIQCAAVVPRSVVELAVEHNGVFIGRVGARVQVSPAEAHDHDTAAGQSGQESGKRFRRHADVWFSFLPEYQGRGFATEAMRAFLPLLACGGGALELEIECDPRNEGSWRMAERLGFERVSLTERVYECKGEWVGSLVYRKVVT
jgi:RimJ/RimL family protein N-acetyltransferase